MTLLHAKPEVLIQGITGREGTFHTHLMKEYGTSIRAGVTPGKGGFSMEGVPVFDTINEAVSHFPMIDTSIAFVPAPHCKEAALEAMEGGIGCLIIITEGVPQHDAIWMVNRARSMGVTLIGPNCPGAIVPPHTKLGIMPASAFMPGHVGIVSRSGTLTYEVGDALRSRGFGVSLAIGVGGDPVTGTTLSEVAEHLQRDEPTETIVVLGEIGGDMEEELAEGMIEGRITKPVVSYIAGRAAPEGKRMGHAGAILQSGRGRAKEKAEALEAAGAHNANDPWAIPEILLRMKKK